MAKKNTKKYFYLQMILSFQYWLTYTIRFDQKRTKKSRKTQEAMKTIDQICLPLRRAEINATRFLTRKNKKLNLPEFWILCSSCSKLLLGHINALSTIEDWSKRNRSLSKRIPDPCLSSKQSITFCKRKMFVRTLCTNFWKRFGRCLQVIKFYVLRRRCCENGVSLNRMMTTAQQRR